MQAKANSTPAHSTQTLQQQHTTRQNPNAQPEYRKLLGVVWTQSNRSTTAAMLAAVLMPPARNWEWSTYIFCRLPSTHSRSSTNNHNNQQTTNTTQRSIRPSRWLPTRYTLRPQRALLWHDRRAITLFLLFDLQLPGGLLFSITFSPPP